MRISDWSSDVWSSDLNERFGQDADVCISLQGGLFNTLNRALELIDVSDSFGDAKLPIYVLNVTYPLIPDEVRDFCAGKRAVLMIEEGQPEFIEHELNTLIRRADLRSEEHTSELQSLMRISYAVLCLKK